MRGKLSLDEEDDGLTPDEKIRSTALKCAVNSYSGGSSNEIILIAKKYERYIREGG